MAPLVGRLALTSSLTCSLGAIACASQPAETAPASGPAAAPERSPEASTHEPAAMARQPDEQVPPPAPTTPTSASQAEPPPPAPASAPIDPTPANAVEPSRKLEVVARLIEPKDATGCNGMHSRPLDVVMRYEILNVVEGTYSEPHVYAVQRCPGRGTVGCEGLAGPAVKKFKVGDTHHLRLDQDLEKRGWFVDLRTDKHLPRYRLTCGNLVPPASP